MLPDGQHPENNSPLVSGFYVSVQMDETAFGGNTSGTEDEYNFEYNLLKVVLC